MEGSESEEIFNSLNLNPQLFINEGVAHIRNMIQSNLDKRLAMWEKYCLKHCFVVPEGFSLRKTNESCDDHSVGFDDIADSELDAQLDTLRDKLTLVGKESAELNRELRALERQSTLSNHNAASVNDALQLYEKQSVNEMFQGLSSVALEELQGFVADLETLLTLSQELEIMLAQSKAALQTLVRLLLK
ncbi:hypothetical protein RJ640_018419, partial [Escallonia rubra]